MEMAKSEHRKENFKHEIKTEKTLVQPNVLSISPIKCGEIFYNEHKALNFFCLLCSDTVNDVTQFSEHILEHITQITINIKQELEYEEINNTFMSEFENEIIQQPQQLEDESYENDDESIKSSFIVDASTSTVDIKKIDSTNEIIISMLSNITATVSKIDANQLMFDQRMHKMETAIELICGSLSVKNSEESIETPFLPIVTIDELNDFEESLKDNGFRKKMFEHIKLFCNDVTVSETGLVHTIFDIMFKRQFFKQVSWTDGSKLDGKKVSFQLYKRVHDFIISLVRIRYPNCSDTRIYGLFKKKITSCTKNAGKRILCQKNTTEIKVSNYKHGTDKQNGISTGNKISKIILVNDDNKKSIVCNKIQCDNYNMETKKQKIFKSELVKSSAWVNPQKNTKFLAKRRRLSEINFHSIDQSFSFGSINDENIPDNEMPNNSGILIDRWKSASSCHI